jgi:zinc transport system substrate-binding protein
MQKNVFYIFIFACFFSFSCRPKSADTSRYISVSIEPQRYFAEKIVGDKFQVKSLVPSGSNPESFDPAPSQMVALGKSKAYFMIGLFGFEKAWMASLSQSNQRMLLVDCSKYVAEEEAHQHHASATGEHHGHSHGGKDPHIWNSPETALAVANSILDGVVRIDPENADYYQSNFNKLVAEIHHTDSIIKKKIAKAKIRTFIIYHPALSYFAEEYRLEQYSVEFNGKSPSPSQMASLVDLAKAKGIKTIFIQPEYDRKNAEVLAREIGGKIVEINPLAYDWKTEMIKIAEALEKQ